MHVSGGVDTIREQMMGSGGRSFFGAIRRFYR